MINSISSRAEPELSRLRVPRPRYRLRCLARPAAGRKALRLPRDARRLPRVAEDHTLHAPSESLLCHRHDHGIIPRGWHPGNDATRFGLVVLRSQGRHGRPVEDPGQPGFPPRSSACSPIRGASSRIRDMSTSAGSCAICSAHGRKRGKSRWISICCRSSYGISVSAMPSATSVDRSM